MQLARSWLSHSTPEINAVQRHGIPLYVCGAFTVENAHRWAGIVNLVYCLLQIVTLLERIKKLVKTRYIPLVAHELE
jgi:hypothetical protein